MKKYGTKNLLRIADNNLNGAINTLEGLKTRLVSWFCFTYNTTPNDDRLLDMTLEELMVLFQMHRVKNDPKIVDIELGRETDYEQWLKEEMGEEYSTPEEQDSKLAEYDKEFEEKQAKNLPDKITTDFSKFIEND